MSQELSEPDCAVGCSKLGGNYDEAFLFLKGFAVNAFVSSLGSRNKLDKLAV